jgi:dolichol-phosphate mannosyltransferase
MVQDLVSIIVPAYKQEKTIVADIVAVEKQLRETKIDYELIVVIDGNVDKTHELVKEVKNIKIRVIAYEKNQGKGYAVRQGVLKARGDIIGFVDAGGDLDLSVISMALSYMNLYNADIVIGSKLHHDSIVNYPLNRRIISVGYRTITRLLFDFEVKDTQVGVKFFRKKVAKDVFRRLLVKKFAFDVEMLAVASVLGYKNIHEIPVKLKFKQGSITNANFWKIAILMFWDTATVFYRIRILRYYRQSNKKNWLKI